MEGNARHVLFAVALRGGRLSDQRERFLKGSAHLVLGGEGQFPMFSPFSFLALSRVKPQ